MSKSIDIQQHKHAIIGCIIYCIFAIILLLLLGFKTPLPLPKEECIIIDFGGGGNPNAGGAPYTAPTTNVNPQHSVPTQGPTTQNFEESASLPNTNKENTEETTTTNTTQTNTTQTNTNTDRLNRLGNIFGPGNGTGTGTGTGSGSGTGGSGSGSGNPGIGGGSGGGTGSGPGGLGGGIGNRRQITKVEPKGKDNMTGVVVLKITVNEDGNVTDIAVVSTTCNECVQLAKNAVKQWKYEAKPGTGYQTGNVTIEFKY